MFNRPAAARPAGLAAVAAAIALAAAACGGGSTPSGPSAQTQVTNNWQAFFSTSTTTSQKVALLQNGSQFANFIAAQEKNPLASKLSATVTKVTVNGNSATVTWTVKLGAQQFNPGQGVAVKVGGKWVVSEATFCNLAQLETGKPPTGCP